MPLAMPLFYRRQAKLIADFDKVAPVHAFLRTLMLQTGKSTVSILPVDYLFWNPPLEGLVSGARAGQMWITGQASALAKSQLASRRAAQSISRHRPPTLFHDADPRPVGVVARRNVGPVMRANIVALR